jgi:UDP-N-acetyl-D-mannosaminuronate dehydrogenase
MAMNAAGSAALPTVAVIGLGYVGLPLVVEFGKHTRTIGFDIIEDKVAKCRAGVDPYPGATEERSASMPPRCSRPRARSGTS